jgi:hypothetical protein
MVAGTSLGMARTRNGSSARCALTLVLRRQRSCVAVRVELALFDISDDVRLMGE